jgi:hypothetical protein
MEAFETKYVHAANKRHMKIIDAHYEHVYLKDIGDSVETIKVEEKRNLLKELQKCEHLFDGTLGNFETSEVKLDLKKILTISW